MPQNGRQSRQVHPPFRHPRGERMPQVVDDKLQSGFFKHFAVGVVELTGVGAFLFAWECPLPAVQPFAQYLGDLD